jgi:hypothetical protein
MKLRDVVRTVAEKVSEVGVDAAGVLVCGPLWLVVRPIVVPVVSKLVGEGLLADPDKALDAAIAELERQDEQTRSVVEAVSAMFENLTEEHFQILRAQASTHAEVVAANQARRRQLYWQILAAWDFARLWLAARNAPRDEDAQRKVRSAAAQLGMSSACIDHIEFKLYREPDTARALVDLIATLKTAVHPFAASMAFTGGILSNKVEAAASEWEQEYGLGSLARPHLEAIALAEGTARQEAIQDFVIALVQLG